MSVNAPAPPLDAIAQQAQTSAIPALPPDAVGALMRQPGNQAAMGAAVPQSPVMGEMARADATPSGGSGMMSGPAAAALRVGGQVATLGQMPETAGDVGMLAGSAAAPFLRLFPAVASKLAHVPLAIQRIILGSVGDGTATLVTGGGTGGFMEGGVAGALGEVPGAALKGAGRAIGKFPVVKDLIEERAAKAAAARTGQAASLMDEARAGAKADVAGATQGARANLSTVRRGVMQDVGAAERAGAEGVAGAERVAGAIDQGASQMQAARFGERVGAVVPPMAGLNTPEAISNAGTYRRDMRKSLGTFWGQKLHEAETALAQGAGEGGSALIRVPSLGVPNERRLSAEKAMMTDKAAKTLGESGMSGKLQPHVEAMLEQEYGPRFFDTMSLSDAAERLKEIGAKGWAGAKADTANITRPGLPWRKQYAQGMSEVEAALVKDGKDVVPGGAAAHAAFEQGRTAFSVGASLLSVLKQERVYDRLPSKVDLDPKGFADAVRARAQDLKDRLPTDGDWTVLREIVFPQGNVARTGASAAATLVPAAKEQAKTAVGAARREGAERILTAKDAARSEIERGRTAATERIAAAQAKAKAILNPEPGRPWTYPFTPSDFAHIWLDTGLQRNLRALGEPGKGEPAPKAGR